MAEHPRRVFEQLAAKLKVKLTDETLATELDRLDKLAPMREEFFYPKNKDLPGVDLSSVDGEEDCVYFTGNSLGLQPRKLPEYIKTELDKWAKIGVLAHTTGTFPWAEAELKLVPRLAPLVGARPSELALMNALTVNLHLLMISFYKPTPTRHKILTENRAFPSDHYAVESQIRLRGYDPKTSLICLHPRKGEATLRLEDVLEVLEREGESIAVVLLPGVQYFTGQRFNIPAITQAGHAKGCYVGWDLAHSIGNHPLQLHDWDVDFAVFCTYKYLSCGAGSIAGAFLHDKFDGASLDRLLGWWGHRHATRFRMENGDDFETGIKGYRLSNPSFMSTIPMAAYLDIYERTSLDEMRRKSVLLTGYLETMLQALDGDLFNIITPSDPEERGAQLSLQFRDDVTSLFEQLKRHGIVTDHRAPRVLRMAPHPLYNSFTDVHRCYRRFQHALTTLTHHNQSR